MTLEQKCRKLVREWRKCIQDYEIAAKDRTKVDINRSRCEGHVTRQRWCIEDLLEILPKKRKRKAKR